ncbi:D-alanyl-D-alanine carboxypeptidase [Streptomyces sp. DH10]|nr:D-alanyl-D-alanine carboxypeptidase [Streptomyces sp. DH10]MDG9707657.1 D-alanyl-D-alanine carboxypeptidase [Streptomyces sp. DH10]
MAGESPDRSKQRESSAEPTSGSASPVPEARSEAAPKRDPRLAVARDTERSAKRGGADTATRVLSARTAEKPGEAADAERDTGETDSTADAEREADAERGEGQASTEGTVADADAERGSGEADSAAEAEHDADDTSAEVSVTEAKQGDSDAGTQGAAADAEQDESDAGTEGAAADAEQDASDAGAERTAANAKRDPRKTDSAADTDQDADDAGTAADAEQDADDAGTAADAEQDAGEADSAADAEQDESDTGAERTAADTKRDPRETDSAADAEQDADDTGAEGTAAGASQRSAEEVVKDSGESSGSGERGDDATASDGRLRDAVAAWVASADQDEEPAATEERAESAGKGAEDGQEAAERAEEATEADTDGKKPEKAAEADVDARDGQDAEGADEAATDVEDRPKADGTDNAATGVQDRPKADGTDNAATGVQDRPKAEDSDEAGEPEADRSATGASGDASADTTTSDDTDDTPEKPETAEADGADEASESDGTDTDKGEAKPPVDQPTAVFKAVRPPVDQPTTMLKLGGATKDAKDTKDAKAAPEKDAERTSKFVALKPLDDPAARKPATAPAPADATAPVPTVGPERTTQQPLPPRPPLDLLAELTNTPPPPDTPLRTAVRRVKIWTPLVLLLVIVFGVVQSVRPLPAPTLELTAEDSYTFEGGKVDIPWPAKGQAALDVQGIGTFGSSGEQKPVPIASVAKVMTAYVILRDHPLKSGADGPKIDIDQAAEDQSDAGQESTVDVTKGDKISQREALESILIASANNVARLLARWDAGSEKAFVGKMNDAAKDLGMKNTTYTDPSGLNNTTVSTAVDQVKLAKAAMEQPAFREVAAMMSYVDYKGTKHDNWNRLVGYNDVTGIKTGTTTSALGNLVFSARKEVNGETRRIVGAVVRQPAGGPDNTILGAALHEGDKLIKAAQGALESATILKKGTVVGYADDGLGGRTPVAVTEDVTAVGWAGLSVKLTFAADELPHTAKAGKKVGTLTVGDGSTNAVKVPVALQKDLVEPGFADKLTRIG